MGSNMGFNMELNMEFNMELNMGFNGDRMGKNWAKIQYALWYLCCLQESSWPYR